ncbi:hypothetical protein ElyMa_005139800, partial [Elysia marginata]
MQISMATTAYLQLKHGAENTGGQRLAYHRAANELRRGRVEKTRRVRVRATGRDEREEEDGGSKILEDGGGK